MPMNLRAKLVPIAIIVAAGLPVPSGSALHAQVIRCYDVVCTRDAQGVLRCVEKPAPCPPDVT
jgi:hypothetical protein